MGTAHPQLPSWSGKSLTKEPADFQVEKRTDVTLKLPYQHRFSFNRTDLLAKSVLRFFG